MVTCPRCHRLAPVRRSGTEAQLACGSCAFAKRSGSTEEPARPTLSDGEVLDDCFSAPLWLQTPCAGHVLWALNLKHLAYIEDYVAKTHRRDRRPFVLFGSALGEQLPKWMVVAKNRDDVLKACRRLRER